MNFSTPINVTAPSLLVITTTGQPSQPSSTEQTNQVSCVNEGILVILFFLGYICIIFGYKKYQRKRISTRQDQIKTLERIWKLAACTKKLDRREH